MHINDEHLYHGAALTQIAEHPNFTAINASVNGAGVKYASEPNKSYGEYVFTFRTDHLADLDELETRCPNVLAIFVCVQDRVICALSLHDLRQHISRRRTARGAPEPHYQLLVTAPAGQQLRGYMNQPGKRKVALPEQLVARNGFPDIIFQ